MACREPSSFLLMCDGPIVTFWRFVCLVRWSFVIVGYFWRYETTSDGLVADEFGSGFSRVLTCWKSSNCFIGNSLGSFLGGSLFVVT